MEEQIITPTTATPTMSPTMPSPATNIPVMDVAPPRTTTTATSAGEPIVATTNDQPFIVTPRPIAVTEAPVAPTVTPTEPVTTPSPSPLPNVESLMGPTPDEAPPQSGAPMPPPANIVPPKAPGDHKTPKAAVIVAIVIAVVLAGLAVFAYFKTQNKPAASTSSTTTNSTATQPATAADVDSTNTSIDASLKKVNDNADFTASDLSDSALGLQ